MPDLFDHAAEGYYRTNAPLADRMRPRTFDDLVGQDDLVGEGAPLRRMVEADRLKSVLLWGPPGTGKTTLARIVAATTGRRFESLSAVTAGVKDVRRVLEEARHALKMRRHGTILFLDEIHRFNKAQQDALLHGVEDGTLTLIGATTENPSFEVNGALLSRMQVLVLKPLEREALERILHRALTDSDIGLGRTNLDVTDDGRAALLSLAAGDARTLLNFLELSALLAGTREPSAPIDRELVHDAAGRRMVLYDKTGEEHYNVVSAFIKSMRGSDVEASVYWLARMLEGGEDPVFVARRLVIFASEDVGNADPEALRLAVAAADAVRLLGMPEGYFALSQCTQYMAGAPKSDDAGVRYERAAELVREHGALPVPLHLRNAPTDLMEQHGYGAGYRNPHREGGHAEGVRYLPDALAGKADAAPRDPRARERASHDDDRRSRS